MKETIWHAILGNDTPPWVVAGARGLLEALLAAGLVFFNTWAQTSDVRLLISGPSVAFLTILTLRWIGEGAIDARKRGGSNG